MEKTLELPLRKEFLKSIGEMGPNIARLYYHAFSCMEAKTLEERLEFLKENISDENWFYDFHKSMRQVDFSGDIYVKYVVDTTTDSDRNRMKELLELLPTYKEKVWLDIVKGSEAREMGLEKEMKEYHSLRRKRNTEERRSVSGHLDMILWNTINLDNDGFLEKFIKSFFKMQEVKL
jgi:hypothetical protein